MMKATTGYEDLDGIITTITPGDNIVWRLDNINNYIPFTEGLAEWYVNSGNEAIYFRFASHKPVLSNTKGITVIETHPETSFESFITHVHTTISERGSDRVYIFDCLSALSEYCYSDRMIGNFFKLTCPYLRERRSIAYFAMYRYLHSYHATDSISSTTQVLIDVYRYAGAIYTKIAKLPKRHSHRQFELYKFDGPRFNAIHDSSTIAEVISTTPWLGLASASYRMVGVWDKTFMKAEAVLEAYNKDQCSEEKMHSVFKEVLQLIISRDERILGLAETYLSLEDVIAIWRRMIGTGLIGGKSVGMLIARAILEKQDRYWKEILEEHDSFFIASDVFYTFLVENGCWWDRQRQKDPETFLDGNEAVRKRILRGNFPDYIVTRFSDMLDYYGYSPIIVRSSSLLEDNFGNAFAGKYESVFCTNQGTKEERLEYFLNAVRLIYASTMSKNALAYRHKRNVLDKDEQMALLVQRVSGSPYGDFYFPQLAGVGFSFNPYAWSKDIEPEAGMVRLVFGLGTRAVDRADDDYTRVIALNAPEKRPESDFKEVKQYTQRRVDVLDLVSNSFSNFYFTDLVPSLDGMPVDLFAVRDRELERTLRQQGMPNTGSRILTFDNLLKTTNFVKDFREMLNFIREAYNSEIDIEFTANFLPGGEYKINLVQCRPLQIQEASETVEELPELDREDIVLEARGAIIGHSRKIAIKRIIFVLPENYGKLSETERYTVAKIIGELTHSNISSEDNVMIIGPGRWGTSTPSLGIPVSFQEIDTAGVLCEVDSMHDGLVPDLSLGTHFFNEMVEMNMLYLACFLEQHGNGINRDILCPERNRLLDLAPRHQKWKETIWVQDDTDFAPRRLVLNANSLEQRAVLYLE
jgi:pyruvate, water dikinase